MSILFESLVLVTIRVTLFLSCRSYVLRKLYSDLQNISTSTSDEQDDIELDVLPTHTNSTAAIQKQPAATHSTISQVVFAGCFSESCILFVLLMCQGVNIFSPETRLIHWKFSLLALLSTILVLGPLVISILLTTGSQKRLHTIRAVISLLPVSLSLFALSRIPLPKALRNDPNIDLLTSSLARLLVVGTIILGLLSGFGAVSSSWAYLPSCISTVREQGTPSDRDIELAGRALERVKDDLVTRKRQLEAKRNATSSSDGGAPSNAGASWYSRMVPNLRGSSDDEAEITGLRMLYEQMDRKLGDLKRRKRDEDFRRTLRGRLFNFVGLLMAIYWAARIVWTAINVLIYRTFFVSSSPSSSTNYPDLVSKLLADLASIIHRYRYEGYEHDLVADQDVTSADLAETQDKIKVIARQISLLFVGLVILTSIRMVLRGVSRTLSRMTKLKLKRNLAASVMLMLLAQLMGIYLLTTIVQLRTSFPPPEEGPLSSLTDSGGMSTETMNLFSTVPPFQVFGSLFDGAFLFAAVASIVVRWMGSKIGAEWDP